MILTANEKGIVLSLCRNVYNDKTIRCKGVSHSKNGGLYDSTKIKLGNTKLSLEVTRKDYDIHSWELSVGGTLIHKDDDGIWWDIVRVEAPKLLKIINDLWMKQYDDDCRNAQAANAYDDRQRIKDLQRAEDYINGWRWWKLWWKPTTPQNNNEQLR